MKYLIVCLILAAAVTAQTAIVDRPIGDGVGGIEKGVAEDQSFVAIPILGTPPAASVTGTAIFQTGPNGQVAVFISYAKHDSKPTVAVIVLPMAFVTDFAAPLEGQARTYTIWGYAGQWVGVRTA